MATSPSSQPMIRSSAEVDVKPEPTVKDLIARNNWFHLENVRLRSQRDRYREKIDEIHGEKIALLAQLEERKQFYREELARFQMREAELQEQLQKSGAVELDGKRRKGRSPTSNEITRRSFDDEDELMNDSPPFRTPELPHSLSPIRVKSEPSVDRIPAAPGENTRQVTVVLDLIGVKQEDDSKLVVQLKSKGNGIFDPSTLVAQWPLPDLKCGHKRFTRQALSNVLGGMVQRLRVNYEPIKGAGAKPIHWATRLPYLAASDKWNPDLPKAPGHHGAIFRSGVEFYTDDDGHQAQLEAVNCFGRRESNSWQYLGFYKVEGHAVLSKEQYQSLSKPVRHARAKGMMVSTWGRKWIADANEQVRKRNDEIDRQNLSLDSDVQEVLEPKIELDIDSIDAAFVRGTMHLEASFIRCVGYNQELYDTLVEKGHINLNDEKRRKVAAASPTKRKRGQVGRAATRASTKETPSESDGELEEESIDERVYQQEIDELISDEDSEIVEVAPRKKVKVEDSDYMP